MAAGAAAASSILNAQRNANAGPAPGARIQADDSVISQSEEDELRALERSADDPAVRTMGVYTEKAPQKKGRITKKPWYIIDPRTSKVIAYTDGLSMMALVFTAIVTCVEVAFVDPSGEMDELFIINRIVDSIFIFDMCLQFVLMYPKPGGAVTDTVRWIHDPDKIAKHYLKGWFAIDFGSIAISAIDIVTLKVFTGGKKSPLSSAKIFRVVRLARLVKLVRLLRASRIMKRLESRVAINYGHMALFKCLFGLIIASHWFACIWGMITQFDNMQDTWYFNNGYCWFDPVDPVDPNNVSLQSDYQRQVDDEDSYVCLPPTDRYIAALYWAIMTITSIGYGDIAATPHNPYEQMICAWLMLFGGMIWGAVIATFCGVIANIDPGGTEFRQTMDNLNKFMATNGLEDSMRISLREYFHQTRHLQVARANRGLLEGMSPMLQGQVVWKINERWLRHVWFLRKAEDKFMVQLSLDLNAAVFAPAELCPTGYMYISHRGIALYGGKVLTSGKVWGEDMILSSPQLRSKFAARCMTYVEVYMISRDKLLDLAKHFPPTLKIIRRSAFRLGFRREMIRRAKDSLQTKAAAAGVVEKGSAAERMLIEISSKEGNGPDDAEIAAGANASPGRQTLPPVGGASNGGVDTGALQKLLGAQLDAMSKQMAAQHEATAKQLSQLSARIDAIASAKPAE